MASKNYDPAQFKQDQKHIWDDIADGWARWEEVFERGASHITSRLLALAEIQPGQRVLDIATGLGEPGISAARVVGATGSVIAIDQAGKMLELARQRAASLPQITFQDMDAEHLDFAPGSFDAVVSRWGVMFLPDIEGTFARVHHLLKPNGKLAISTWAPPPKVPMIATAFGVIARQLQLPPPPEGLPGPFTLSNPAQIEAMLSAAGFRAITVEPTAVPFVLPSAQAFAEFSRDILPPRMKSILASAGPDKARQVWDEVAAIAEGRKAADGTIAMSSEAICVQASA